MRSTGLPRRLAGLPRVCRIAAVVIQAAFVASAVATTDSPPRQWALIIAVQNYAEKGFDLKYTLNDARWLEHALKGCGVPAGRIVMMGEDSPAEKRPTRENLELELKKFLGNKELGPGDGVFVYFSGHGEIHNGVTFLRASDTRSDRLDETALPVSEVREALRDCRAGYKVLVLDSCHAAGGGKNVVDDASTSGCAVLASCKLEEKSFEWEPRKQSIFSYWLRRALEGEADEDTDGRLSLREIFDYAQVQTRMTARSLGERQEPDRRGLDAISDKSLFAVPETPEAVTGRFARKLDKTIRASGLRRVLITEFRQRTPGGLVLAPALFPGQSAIALRKRLKGLAVDDEGMAQYQLLELDRPSDFPVDGRFDDAAVRRLRRVVEDVDAVIFGTIERRGRGLHAECELVRLTDRKGLATMGGAIAPDEERILAMDAGLDDRDRPSGAELRDRDSKVRIEVWSIETRDEDEEIGPGTVRRRCEYRSPPIDRDGQGIPRRDLVVASRPGKPFEIRVWNDRPEPVAMTLRVDGINTLGITRDPPGPSWSWVLGPTNDPSRPFVFEGFYSTPPTRDNEPGTLRGFLQERFTFPEPARPDAARRSFGEPPGIISVSLYAEKRDEASSANDRPDATGRLGTEKFRAGPLISAVQIRYVVEGAAPP